MQSDKKYTIQIKDGMVYKSQDLESWSVETAKVKISESTFTISAIYIMLSIPYIILTIIK